MELVCPEMHCGRKQNQVYNTTHNVFYFYCECGFSLLPQERVNPFENVTQIELNKLFEKRTGWKINS